MSFSVLKRRVVTEKAAAQEADGQYTFLVDPDVSKMTIQQAIRQRYGVRPRAVRIVHVRSRRVRFGRTFGHTRAWKKAIVQLPEGTKIEGEKSTT